MFKVHANLPDKIHKAALLATNFLHNVREDDLDKLHPFTYYPNGNASQVFYEIVGKRMANPAWPVLPWSPWNRWTKAIATTFGEGAIHINVRKIGSFEIHDYVNTLCHESMHNLGFGHGSNYPSPDKMKSVPYAVGALAEAWARNHV